MGTKSPRIDLIAAGPLTALVGFTCQDIFEALSSAGSLFCLYTMPTSLLFIDFLEGLVQVESKPRLSSSTL